MIYMSELEKLIAQMMDSGSDSAAIAKYMTDTLNKVTKEKEDEKSRVFEEKKKKVNWYNDIIMDMIYDFVNSNHDDEVTNIINEGDFRLVGYMAVAIAYGWAENKDWTVEEMKKFAKAVTHNMELLYPGYSGHAKSQEERVKKLVSGANKIVEQTIDRTGFKNSDLKEWLRDMGW